MPPLSEDSIDIQPQAASKNHLTRRPKQREQIEISASGSLIGPQGAQLDSDLATIQDGPVKHFYGLTPEGRRSTVEISLDLSSLRAGVVLAGRVSRGRQGTCMASSWVK